MGRPLGRKCPRAGVRVRHPGGDTGVVTKVLQPSGQKKACAGDLVYVQWDAGMVVGVPRDSLERTRAKGGLGSLTLGDVWRMNPAGREGPPMAAGRVIDVQPGDYVVNDQNLEPIRLPQYRSASQLLDKLQDEWALAQDKYGILERDRSGRVGLKPDRQGQMFGLGDNHDWTPRQYAEALDPLNRRVFVTSVEGDHAIVVPAQNFSRGLPLRVPLTSLRPLRGLGMEWDGSPQPGRRGDPGRRWRVVPHVGVETKPQWASTFFPTGILLKDINPALAKYPGDLVPVPEWNHLSESYIEEEPDRWGHESYDPGAIVVRDGIRHKLWPREDLQLMLAAEDHYRGIMPPETTFQGFGASVEWPDGSWTRWDEQKTKWLEAWLKKNHITTAEPMFSWVRVAERITEEGPPSTERMGAAARALDYAELLGEDTSKYQPKTAKYQPKVGMLKGLAAAKIPPPEKTGRGAGDVINLTHVELADYNLRETRYVHTTFVVAKESSRWPSIGIRFPGKPPYFRWWRLDEALVQQLTRLARGEAVMWDANRTFRIVQPRDLQAFSVWLDGVLERHPYMRRAEFGGLGSLGSTDAEHATDFDTARFELVNAVNDAQLALRQGQCRVASTLVGEADVNYGRLQANAMTTASMGTALDLFKQLAKVQTEFDEKCVRDEPVSESYDRTMRAMRPGLAGARMVTIPAAHLREDVKEARGMVKELQRGIKRDVKALGSDIGWFPKAGRDALDPMGRVVYIVRIDGDMATVKLGGSYGAHVQVPVTALREPR